MMHVEICNKFNLQTIHSNKFKPEFLKLSLKAYISLFIFNLKYTHLAVNLIRALKSEINHFDIVLILIALSF